MDLAPGEFGDLNIKMEIHPIDTGFAFATVFLDDDDNDADGSIDVWSIAHGMIGPPEKGIFYEQDFNLPADISWHNHGPEYQLTMARTDGLNWGAGVYLLDTLTLKHTGEKTSGTVPVTFESGARHPFILTAGFTEYYWNIGMAGDFPNVVDPGVGAEDSPFNIHLIPEPGTLLMLVACLIAGGWRRRGLPGV